MRHASSRILFPSSFPSLYPSFMQPMLCPLDFFPQLFECVLFILHSYFKGRMNSTAGCKGLNHILITPQLAFTSWSNNSVIMRKMFHINAGVSIYFTTELIIQTFLPCFDGSSVRLHARSMLPKHIKCPACLAACR